jgi:DNA-binding NarL/FixJ family response regulator
MPGIGGIEVARALPAERPDLPILMLTMFRDDASLFSALRAGAHG